MNNLDDPVSEVSVIDSYIRTEMKRLGIPGLALGVVHRDQVVYVQGFGVADSTGRDVTPATPFHMGSLTKSLTALAVRLTFCLIVRRFLCARTSICPVGATLPHSIAAPDTRRDQVRLDSPVRTR
jgi:hypothetical protein